MSPRWLPTKCERNGRLAPHDAGEILDVRGLLCPIPVIRTQQKVVELDSDRVLTILATDPGVLEDIPTWCRIHGHQHLASDEHDGEYRLSIRVRKA